MSGGRCKYFSWNKKKDKSEKILEIKSKKNGQQQPSIQTFFKSKSEETKKRRFPDDGEEEKTPPNDTEFKVKLERFVTNEEEEKVSSFTSLKAIEDLPVAPDDDESRRKYRKVEKTEVSQQQSLESVIEASKTRKPTPLEEQVIDLKKRYPNVLLFVACGYRYRFFGDDAIKASKILGIMISQDKLFITASVPSYNGPMYYVRKLVREGLKVGIASQTETTKSSSSSLSKLFYRDLSEVYTATTLVTEDLNLEKSTESSAAASILAVFESKKVAIVSFEPTTGRIIYDDFVDDKFRSKLKSRLAVIQPLEILYFKGLSVIEGMIREYAESSKDVVRLEEASNYFSLTEIPDDPCFAQVISDLTCDVIRCFNAIYNYLKLFGLERTLLFSKNLEKFSSYEFMRLSSLTLCNLEVFVSNGRKKTRGKGSLFHLLNRTNTQFGARLLKQWIGKPLMDVDKILERQDAIAELIQNFNLFQKLDETLIKMPDLELALMCLLSKKISTKSFYCLCTKLRFIQKECLTFEAESPLLRNLLSVVKESFSGIDCIMENLNDTDKKEEIFKDWSKFPEVGIKRSSLAEIETKLDEHRKEICRILGLTNFNYASVSGLEYLIELKNSLKTPIPNSWSKVSSTKTVIRYRDPFINENYTQLQFRREALAMECRSSWLIFLESFLPYFHRVQRGIKYLAELDCLLSLTKISKQDRYVRPSFDSSEFRIRSGRNPIVEQAAHNQQYVPNDLDLTTGESLVLTGPNMGGKSCFLRQTAIICIMAQVGFYVPADFASLPILDAILIRIGARDDLWAKKSTFLVELEDAASILREASSKSLVLMDELGRGTSTHDGIAIAEAVLNYLNRRIRCFTIFVTHYKSVTRLENVTNGHMGYMTNTDENVILFLYKLRQGVAESSYGFNVARMAGIEGSLIDLAAKISSQRENVIKFQTHFMKLISSS